MARFCKGISEEKRIIASMQCYPAHILSSDDPVAFRPCYIPFLSIENDTTTKTYSKDTKPLYQVANCIATLQNTVLCVLVVTSWAGLRYIVHQENLKHKRILELSSGNWKPVHIFQYQRCLWFCREPSQIAKRSVIWKSNPPTTVSCPSGPSW